MAKKKKTDPEEDDDNFGEDLFGDDEIESIYPKIEKSTEADKVEKVEEVEGAVEAEFEEELEFELEQEAEAPDYKYLSLEIKSGIKENDYELKVIGQSHGFCNILVKHLLEVEGVKIAAYKYTRIEPAKIFIQIEQSNKIKEILHKAIESLREEVMEVQKLFEKIS
ncbi:MAG: hypothetical protein GF383_05040 [Candidatus Lokiarchaeota archaeon]|nr:hypothetical protein [Candidatus Lokiarchaeota archaeon]MBD3339243.1 hypothetical protein [Candidatus Lokiarchaeota archaeon]